MIFSEDRFPLFRIMPQRRPDSQRGAAIERSSLRSGRSNAACYRNSVAAVPNIVASVVGPVADQTARNGIGVCDLRARVSVPN
jgi:hypothetical protein